jgi:hypothetical protein
MNSHQVLYVAKSRGRKRMSIWEEKHTEKDLGFSELEQALNPKS